MLKKNQEDIFARSEGSHFKWGQIRATVQMKIFFSPHPDVHTWVLNRTIKYLISGALNALEFLRAVSHSLDSYVHFHLDSSSDEDSDSSDESGHDGGDGDSDYDGNGDRGNGGPAGEDEDFGAIVSDASIDEMLQDDDQPSPNPPADLNEHPGDYPVVQDEFEPVDAQSTCSVCLINAIERIALVPCGHSSFCNNCVDTLLAIANNPRCPVCRSDIQMKMNLFN